MKSLVEFRGERVQVLKHPRHRQAFKRPPKARRR